MKLAKKTDQAVLSFEITGTTRVGRRVKVTHDVKIEVMKPSDVDKLSEPLCPEPDVCIDFTHSSALPINFLQTHILLPPLQKLRTIVDRLRPMSDILAVRANNNGCLQISIHTESVKVETEWRGCTNPTMGRPAPLSAS